MRLNALVRTLMYVAAAIAVAGCAPQINRAGFTKSMGTSVYPSISPSPSPSASASVDHLIFSAEPTNTTSGAAIAPSVTVEVVNSLGVVDSSSTASVTVAIGNNPVGGTLSGVLTLSAVNGVVSFPGINIDLAGSNYTLTASSSGLTTVASTGFNISASSPTQLVFTTQPANAQSGSSLGSIAVTVEDADGNTVTSSSASITLAIGNNAGPGGALSGTATVSAINGVATFPGLNINVDGNAYTLTASAASLSGTTSSAFNISASSPAMLVFGTQPASAQSGATLGSITVKVEDSAGNLITGSTASITLAILNNAGPGGSLSGTKTVSASSGIATFPGLNIDIKGTGYTLSATSASLSSATSSSFNISAGSATKLVFTTQPSNAQSNASLGSIAVTVEDAAGNTVSSSTASITLAIGNNAGPGGTLSGTKVVSATAGIASFPGLSIDVTGTGYTLTASAASLTGTTSSGFDISASAPNKLAFTAQPANAQSGASLGSITVSVEDGSNNVITSSSASITLAIGTNAGPGGTLSGTKTVSAINGVATFPGLSIDVIGTAYTLTASSASLSSATSSTFNITTGGASKLVFGTQPASAQSGASLGSITVKVEDSGGNVVTSSTAAITLAIGTNAGPGGTLSGTLTVNASSGIATFPGLSIDVQGTGYTLTASGTSLSGTTSSGFNITVGSASKLIFTAQPSNAQSGATLGSIAVSVEDSGGNVVTSSTASITLAIGTNAGPGGTLSGTKTVSAVSGVATFTGLNIDIAGTGYTLTASAASLTGTTSSAFNITAGTATKLVFTTQPANAASGVSLGSVTVTVEDSVGNTVTTSVASITLAIGTNAGPGGTLSGTKVVAAVSGIASFPGLSIDKKGTGYTLTASATSLTGATSSTFNITVGAASKLAFTTQPTNTQAGSNISTVKVTVEDVGGNKVTTSSASITIAIGTNPSGGTLSGTVTVSASSGVATFTTLQINLVGTGYTLAASSGSLTSAASSTFNITTASIYPTLVGGPLTITAGVCTLMTMNLQDGGGNNYTVASNTTLTFSNDESFDRYFSDSNCTVPTWTVVVPSGSHSTTFYYQENLPWQDNQGTAGPAPLVYNYMGVLTVVGPNARSAIAGPSIIVPGTCSSAFKVTSLDKVYNQAPVSGNTTVTLSTTGSTTFYSDSSCGTSLPSNQLTILNSAYSAEFYAKTTATENATLTSTIAGDLSNGQFNLQANSTAHTLLVAFAIDSVCYVIDGSVKCWGGNYYGQLGNGTNTDSMTPVTVSGLSGVTQIAASAYTYCAVNSSGVWCWGDNNYGQCGNGVQYNTYNTPVQASVLNNTATNLTGPANVSGAANDGFCAIQSGTVYCWFNNILVPTAVSLPRTALSVGVGGYYPHACAGLNDGTVWCWGQNDSGQLGNGTTTNSTTPVEVSGITSGATAVALSGQASCAIVSGSLYCWGSSYTTTAVNQNFSGTVSQISGSDPGIAIIKSDGSIWYQGQSTAGDGTGNSYAPPNFGQSLINSGALSVAPCGFGGCAVVTSAGGQPSLQCWADDDEEFAGYSGDGSTGLDLSPFWTYSLY
jgi:hypothetical protein